MMTPQVGWAVAVDRNGYSIAVVRTADGGRTWRVAGPPGLSGHNWNAAFYSARDAWVTWNNPRRRARPVTYQTTDGGRTWARMGSIPIAALGTSAPDMVTGQLGWVTAGLGGVAAGSSGIAIFQTTDGGTSWQLTALTDYNRHTPGAIPLGCDKGFAVFSSAATGWVTGTCAGGRTAFWASRDGGRTWRYQPLPPPSGHGTLPGCQCFLTAPVFISSQNGAMWGSGIPVPHALAAAGYLTHDGGRTWAPITLPGRRVPLQTPDFVDGPHGFVLGGRLSQPWRVTRDVRLYATTDGGATWTARSSSPLFGRAARAGQVTLDFLTPATGFASLISYNPLRSYLLETRTRGAAWTVVPAQLVGRA